MNISIPNHKGFINKILSEDKENLTYYGLMRYFTTMKHIFLSRSVVTAMNITVVQLCIITYLQGTNT